MFHLVLQTSSSRSQPSGTSYEPEGREFESLRAHHLNSWHPNEFRTLLF